MTRTPISCGTGFQPVIGAAPVRKRTRRDASSFFKVGAPACGALLVFCGTFGLDGAAAQLPPEPPQPFLSAREAVRRGNQLLRDGKPEEALQAYAQAKSLQPGALEIPFVQGLGRYQLQDYAAARDLWSSAALADDSSLADAATYSLGTTYHSEALQQGDKPEEASKLLERAMERYQQVLAHDPQHVAAHDALRKAASLRRQIKEMMQQQQQQPNQEKSDEEKQEESKQDQSSENSQQTEQEKSEEQQSQDSSEQQEKQEQESSQEQPDEESKSESAPQDKQEESESKDQPQSSDSPEEKESEEPSGEMKAQPNEEDSSHDQAERQLREMMQSLRDRQKNRKEPARRVPIQPAEKDW